MYIWTIEFCDNTTQTIHANDWVAALSLAIELCHQEGRIGIRKMETPDD